MILIPILILMRVLMPYLTIIPEIILLSILILVIIVVNVVERMEVECSGVKAVYIAAHRLKMDRVVNFCARYLVDHLDPATAIEICSLPGIALNPVLASQVDAYLAAEVHSTTHSLRTPKLFN